MVKFSDAVIEAAALCIDRGVPFCMYAFPGDDSQVHFFSNPSGVSTGGKEFIIGCWREKTPDFIHIHEEFDAKSTMENIRSGCKVKPVSPTPWDRSIDRTGYLKKLHGLIDTIKTAGLGKVVLSRTCDMEVQMDGMDYVLLARSVFEAFPKSFRHLYYTHQTGYWLGATPELMLRYDSLHGRVATMALAGTRSASDFESDSPWDTKDVEEQAMVTKFIVGKLESMGFDVKCSSPYTLITGNLQHIATSIDGSCRGDSTPGYDRILDSLNPTPALCGYPRESAAVLLDRLEEHPRRCYGGVIGIKEHGDVELYVNLRCMQFSDNHVCLYAGGGILGISDADKEWEETEKKMNSLRKFITERRTDGRKR